MDQELDLAVLSHLRGYPQELRRFTTLMKQAHPQGRTASEFFLSRPVPENSLIAALCRLIRSGEEVVTVVEAAELLGVSPDALLEFRDLPPPLAGQGRHQVWRRSDIARWGATSSGSP